MIIELPDLPGDWVLTHLIALDPGWQVNLRDEHHVVVATGDSPATATHNAIEKIFLEDFAGPLFRINEDLLKTPRVDPKILLENLGLATPLNIPRRTGL